MSWMHRLNVMEMPVLPKLVYKSKIAPVNIPRVFFRGVAQADFRISTEKPKAKTMKPFAQLSERREFLQCQTYNS